jgi:hypothetical protein
VFIFLSRTSVADTITVFSSEFWCNIVIDGFSVPWRLKDFGFALYTVPSPHICLEYFHLPPFRLLQLFQRVRQLTEGLCNRTWCAGRLVLTRVIMIATSLERFSVCPVIRAESLILKKYNSYNASFSAGLRAYLPSNRRTVIESCVGKVVHKEIVAFLNVVGIATGFGLDDRRVGVRVLVGFRIFRLWGPPSLLSNRYRGPRAVKQ